MEHSKNQSEQCFFHNQSSQKFNFRNKPNLQHIGIKSNSNLNHIHNSLKNSKYPAPIRAVNLNLPPLPLPESKTTTNKHSKPDKRLPRSFNQALHCLDTNIVISPRVNNFSELAIRSPENFSNLELNSKKPDNDPNQRLLQHNEISTPTFNSGFFHLDEIKDSGRFRNSKTCFEDIPRNSIQPISLSTKNTPFYKAGYSQFSTPIVHKLGHSVSYNKIKVLSHNLPKDVFTVNTKSHFPY